MLSPARFPTPETRLLRLSKLRFARNPPPTKKPLFEIQSSPRNTSNGDLTSNDAGRSPRVGSVLDEDEGPRVAIVLSKYFSPNASAVNRSDCRVGTATPKPYRKLAGKSSALGDWRAPTPA